MGIYNKEVSVRVRGDMKRTLTTAVLLVLAIALIIIGICDSQFGPVLAKASKVCLECVGIG